MAALAACATPKGASVADKRAYVLRMHDQALEDLYRARPELRERLPNSAGYGVFSSIGVKVFLLGGTHGFGVVVDNATGKETFMRMFQVGAGVGIGARDYRAVYVFRDADALQRFVDYGWELAGDADASAIAGGDQGVSAGVGVAASVSGASAGAGGVAGVGSVDERRNEVAGTDVEIYRFTENGLAAQAMVEGARYWQDTELNAGP